MAQSRGAIRTLGARAKQSLSLVRFAPFDVSTPEGRSKERYRRVALATLASIAARGISFLTTLISIPLTLNYLGAERFGLWVTISSTIAMIAFADLGLGNGLVNAIADADGKHDRTAARTHVSSAFFILTAIATILLCAFALLYPLVPWARVFNVTSTLAIQEVGPAVAIFVLCFALNLPLGVVQRVQMGYQELFVNAWWQALGNLLGLAGVVLVIQLRAGLPWLVLALTGAPALAALLNSVVLFALQRPWLRPQLSRVSRASVRAISRIGFLFFVLQIAVAVAYQSDSIVVAQVLGADQVTQYAVPMRLFSLAPMILSFMLMPLWPAYGESIARGDIDWVRKTLKKSLFLSLATNVPSAVLLAVLGSTVIRWWVGPNVTPSFLLLLGLGLWAILNSFGGPLAALLNGANVIRFQAICSLLMAVANLALSIVLTHVIGVSGVVFGTVITQLVFVFLPSAFYVPRLLSAIEMRRAPRRDGSPPVSDRLNQSVSLIEGGS